MIRKKRGHRLIRNLFATCLLVATVGFLLGCWRYGGPEGFLKRAQIALASQRSHPLLVPTPLPVSFRQQAAAAMAAPIVHSTVVLLPTVTPTPPIAAPALTTTVALTTEEPLSASLSVLDANTELTSTVTVVPPTPVPTPTPLFAPAADFVELTGLHHYWQTWNNCGPATLAMQLSYFGTIVDQSVTGAALRSHEDDKNVMPEELAAYARSQGYAAHVMINGKADQLRLLLSNGIPVLVETWLEDQPNDGMGHYRLLVGYDHAARQWFAYDSYDQHNLRNPDPNGPYRGIQFDYAEFDALWKVFNHTYVLIYPPEKRELVANILGSELDPAQMWQNALGTTQAAASSYPEDPYHWFNLGTVLAMLGRYEEAATVYDRARQLGLPWRMLWYQFGPFEAYYETGRYQEVVALSEATLATTTSIEELHYWRGQGLAALGNRVEAESAWQRALALNPRYAPAQAASAYAAP